MQVETYECQEVQEETIEMSDEAVGLIESMELVGQKKLLTKTDEDTEIVRCPYREMKRDERFVYNLLCPVEHKIEEYTESAIPLRVLQVLAHAKQFELFKTFRIWTAEGQIKDPVLVAYDEISSYGSATGTRYILARWADELDAWPQLVKKAIEKYRLKYRAALLKIQQKVSADLAIVDEVDIETAIKDESPYYSSW